MSTSVEAPVSPPPPSRHADRLGGICLALGGIAFAAGGMTHPSDDGHGTKVEQLYQAFRDPAWYPSHALMLASFALFTAAILLLRTRNDLARGMAQLVNVVAVVSVIATAGMVVHLFSALGASSIADGQPSLVYEAAKWNETILSTLWGLSIIALASAGGATGTLGNRVTMPMAVVGGGAWSMATATIAFTDTFDALFPISSLISAWAVAAGAMWATTGTRQRHRRTVGHGKQRWS